MKLLKSRKFAALFMVLAISGSLFLGTRGTLLSKAEKAESEYYNADDGYGNIEEYFSSSLDCAERLYKLCGQKDEAYEKAVDFAKNAKSAGDKYAGGQKLMKAAENYYSAVVDKSSLDDTDLKTAARLYEEITGNAQKVENVTLMRRDAYNEAASEYNEEVLGTIPASLIYKFIGAQELELIY